MSYLASSVRNLKKEVEAAKRNSSPRGCLDVVIEDLALRFPGTSLKEINEGIKEARRALRWQ